MLWTSTTPKMSICLIGCSFLVAVRIKPSPGWLCPLFTVFFFFFFWCWICIKIIIFWGFSFCGFYLYFVYIGIYMYSLNVWALCDHLLVITTMITVVIQFPYFNLWQPSVTPWTEGCNLSLNEWLLEGERRPFLTLIPVDRGDRVLSVGKIQWMSGTIFSRYHRGSLSQPMSASIGWL